MAPGWEWGSLCRWLWGGRLGRRGARAAQLGGVARCAGGATGARLWGPGGDCTCCPWGCVLLERHGARAGGLGLRVRSVHTARRGDGSGGSGGRYDSVPERDGGARWGRKHAAAMHGWGALYVLGPGFCFRADDPLTVRVGFAHGSSCLVDLVWFYVRLDPLEGASPIGRVRCANLRADVRSRLMGMAAPPELV
eukprot:1756480-Prymnesium_polylepis.1